MYTLLPTSGLTWECRKAVGCTVPPSLSQGLVTHGCQLCDGCCQFLLLDTVPLEAVRAVTAFSPPSWVQLTPVGPNLSLLSHFTALYNHCPSRSVQVLAADAKTTALQSFLNWLPQLHEANPLTNSFIYTYIYPYLQVVLLL